MLMTYDFVMMAIRDAGLMRELQDALAGQSDREVFTDMHKLKFNSMKQTVYVEARSDAGIFSHKIVPKEISYSALSKMLAGDWEGVYNEIEF